MKAPDKIYLHGYEFDKTPCDRWDAEPTPKKMFGYKAKFVEYIRKDALLGILNELIKDCEDSNSYVLGLTALAYKDVINKIESL